MSTEYDVNDQGGDVGGECVADEDIVYYPFLEGIDPANPPATVDISQKQLEVMGNMERQYWEIKAAHFNVVIFFKKGKFYELYDQDAALGHKEFGLKMVFDTTNRGKMRLAGVPEQSLTEWARLFVFRGYKVGRVEQLKIDGDTDSESSPSSVRAPAVKPKVMPRDLVQILTPGTIKDPAMLSGHEGRFVLALVPKSFGCIDAFAVDLSRNVAYHCPCAAPEESIAKSAGTSAQDSQTFLSAKVLSSLTSLLQHLQPKEILLHARDRPSAGTAAGASGDLDAFTSRIAKWVQSEGCPLEIVKDCDAPCVLARSVVSAGARANQPSSSGPSAQQLLWGYFKYLRLNGFEEELDGVVQTYTAHVSDNANHGSQADSNEAETSSASSTQVKPMKNSTDSLLTFERRYDRGMTLDAATVSNLELVANLMDGSERDSFANAFNRCCTNGGKRLFRQWVLRPSSSSRIISARQEAVKFIADHGMMGGWCEEAVPMGGSPMDGPARRSVSNASSTGAASDSVSPLRTDAAVFTYHSGAKRPRTSTDINGGGGSSVFSACALRSRFANVVGIDFERNMSRLSELKNDSSRVAYVDPLLQYKKNLSLILSTVGAFGELFEWASAARTEMTQSDTRAVPLLIDELLQTILAVRPALSAIGKLFDKEEAAAKGLITPNSGTSKEYDEATRQVTKLEEQLNEILESIRQSTFKGAAGVTFNDIGKDIFLVEVPIQFVPKLAPSGFVERTRTTKSVKYIVDRVTPLAEQHKKSKTEQSHALVSVLQSVATSICDHCPVLFDASAALSYLDCLLGLATLSAAPLPTCIPIMEQQDSDTVDGASLSACGLYHPLLSTTPVANDIHLDHSHGRVLLLTGPNMAGKSTLMRTVAINMLLAQMGGYVCANSFSFSPVHRIFTRIGARDASEKGHSTLFVELAETSDIVRHANSRSLCLLDELGRGTSTHDGYAIAYATLAYIRKKCSVAPLVLFSTHYHALAQEIHQRQTQEQQQQQQHQQSTHDSLNSKEEDTAAGTASRDTTQVTTERTSGAVGQGADALAHTAASCAPTSNTVQLGYMDFVLHGTHKDTRNENGRDAHSAQQKGDGTPRIQSVTFLYKLVSGICLRSYGVEVALMAGIPASVVGIAQQKSSGLAQQTSFHSDLRSLSGFLNL